MIHQCRVIDHNKYTTLVEKVNTERSYVYVGEGDIWELSVPNTKFWCEPKVALKNKVYFLKTLKIQRKEWTAFKSDRPRISAMLNTSCVTLDNLLKFLELQFSYFVNEDIS